MNDEKNPQISICLPTYNQPVLIKDAIESILNQTYTNLELIISNNCSPDPEVDRICREYAAKDSRIRYFCQKENLGCERNAAFCISQIKNNLFYTMADDDILGSTFIEKCLRKMQQTKNCIGCCSIIKYRKPLEIDLDSNSDLTSSNPVDRIIKWTMQKHWMGGALFDYSAIKDCSTHYKNVFGWDVLYNTQMLLLGKIARVEEPLFTYQVRTKSKDVKRISEDNKDFNKYSIIDINLDIMMRTFELVFETDKLNIFQKIEFYIKMWLNISKTPIWRIRFWDSHFEKYINNLFEDKLYNDIFYFMPYIIYYNCKKFLFFMRHLKFMLEKVHTDTVLVINNDENNGEYLQKLLSHLINERKLEVDLLSPMSYKKYLKHFKNYNLLKTKQFRKMYFSEK